MAKMRPTNGLSKGHGHVVGYLVVHDVAVDKLDLPARCGADCGRCWCAPPRAAVPRSTPVTREWVPHGRLEDGPVPGRVDEHVVSAYRPRGTRRRSTTVRACTAVRCRDAPLVQLDHPEVRIPRQRRSPADQAVARGHEHGPQRRGKHHARLIGRARSRGRAGRAPGRVQPRRGHGARPPTPALPARQRHPPRSAGWRSVHTRPVSAPPRPKPSPELAHRPGRRRARRVDRSRVAVAVVLRQRIAVQCSGSFGCR